jgi:hypothetical protein
MTTEMKTREARVVVLVIRGLLNNETLVSAAEVALKLPFLDLVALLIKEPSAVTMPTMLTDITAFAWVS